MKPIDQLVYSFRKHKHLCWVGLIFITVSIFFRMDQLKIQLLPNLSPLKYYVTTSFSNHSAEVVDLTLSLPMSNRISSLKSVNQIKTYSSHGFSRIEIELNLGSTSWEFKEELYQLLFELKNELPLGVGLPKVSSGKEYQNPFFEFTIKKNTFLSKTQFFYNINQMKYKIERIPGVVEVKKMGDHNPTVIVSLNESKLSLYPIKLSDLEYQFTSAIKSGSLGKISEVDQESEIKFDSEIKSLDEIQKFPFHFGDGKWIQLENIASASIVSLPSDEIVEINGQRSVYFAVYVDCSKNPLEISNQIQQILEEYDDTLQPKVYSDSSIELKSQISQFLFFLTLSLFFASLFSYLMYRQWFPVICLLVSVLFSLIFFFHLLVSFSLSVNLLSLSGISVGIGMLFDANNLIYYSIQSTNTQNKDKVIAVTNGISNVFISLFSSCLTTIVVLFPLLFYAHEWRDFFYDIGLSVILLILSSLFTSVTIVPLFFLSFSGSNGRSFHFLEAPIFKRIVKISSNRLQILIIFVIFGFVLISNFKWGFNKFQIFPKPNPIGQLIQVSPMEKISMKEERFIIQEIQKKFEQDYPNQQLLILPFFEKDEIDAKQFAIPFLLKWYESDSGSTNDTEVFFPINAKRWNLKRINLQSELALSLPFLPTDSVMVFNERWEKLMEWMETMLVSNLNLNSKGKFDSIPNVIQMKEWKSNLFLNPELLPDLDDLKQKVLLKNTPKYIGMLGIENPIPIYFELLGSNNFKSEKNLNQLPTFKSHSKESIFPDALFRMKEKKSYSEYKREAGKFYIEWLGDLSIEKNLKGLEEEGFQYKIRSEKNETISFYCILFVLLVFSFLFIYLVLVGIFESFFRPFIYLSISLLYSIAVLFCLVILVPEIHFGHYMGLIVLIGLSLDSISLFGERWEYSKNIKNRKEKIQKVLEWLTKPIILNVGTTFFGLLPVVLIVFPGSEFVRAIAVTICIGILVSLFFIFKIYPLVFQKYLNLNV